MTRKDFYTAAYKDYVQDKFKTLVQLWGSTRKAAEHCDISYSYISRLSTGKEIAPPGVMMKMFPEDAAYILELLNVEMDRTVFPEPSDIRPIDGQIRGELDVSTGKVRYFYANKLKKVSDILNAPQYYRAQENSNASVTVGYDINDISDARDSIKLVLKCLEAENEDPSGQDA